MPKRWRRSHGLPAGTSGCCSILRIQALRTVTKEVVEAARENLVIGSL
jgi:hypothetical protein